MQADVEQQFRFLESEQVLKQDQMSRTAHRKKFGETLDRAKYNRFNKVQQSAPRLEIDGIQESPCMRLPIHMRPIGYPLITQIGLNLATFFDIPAPCTASTTWLMSL